MTENKFKCFICDEETSKPWRSAFSHFWLWYPGQWRYLRGNVRTFGLLQGVHSWVCLVCPAYNTVRYWKYRKMRLYKSQNCEGD